MFCCLVCHRWRGRKWTVNIDLPSCRNNCYITCQQWGDGFSWSRVFTVRSRGHNLINSMLERTFCSWYMMGHRSLVNKTDRRTDRQTLHLILSMSLTWLLLHMWGSGIISTKQSRIKKKTTYTNKHFHSVWIPVYICDMEHQKIHVWSSCIYSLDRV